MGTIGKTEGSSIDIRTGIHIRTHEKNIILHNKIFRGEMEANYKIEKMGMKGKTEGSVTDICACIRPYLSSSLSNTYFSVPKRPFNLL